MDMTPNVTEYVSDSKEWLGSAHGTNNADPVTLDATLMRAVFTDGNVPSGVVVGRVTTSGRYGPYNNAAVDGREVARGHLLNPIKVKTGQNAGAAMLRHGHVFEARLPTNHGLDAPAKVELSQFIYI